MKKKYTRIFSSLLLACLCLCSIQIKSYATADAAMQSEASGSSKGFYVSGTKLYDASGKEFVASGYQSCPYLV